MKIHFDSGSGPDFTGILLNGKPIKIVCSLDMMDGVLEITKKAAKKIIDGRLKRKPKDCK